MDTYTLNINDNQADQRLDIFLASNLEDCPSRNFAKHLIENNLVSVNKRILKPHYKVQIGDVVEVSVDMPRNQTISPENIDLDIFYEDEDIIVVNKPIGMVVHPGAGCRGGTLANALLFYCQQLSDVSDPLRPGIVHRLDKETSGLIIAAKNNKSHVRLSRQFEKRRIKKCYVALVEKLIEFDEGLIDVPLGRDPKHREKRCVLAPGAKSAQTIYKVMRRFNKTTLVSLMLKTGRTHQLRVHMAHLCHSILGDEKYGRKNNFPRLALHARSIGFKHPTNMHWLEFSSPIPKEFLESDL